MDDPRPRNPTLMPDVSEKQTIVRLIDRLNVGGPAIHVILLSRYLDALSSNSHRWRTVLVYGQEGKTEGNMRSLLQREQLSPIYIPSLGRELHPLYDLVSLWKVLRLIWKEKPAVVHTHKSKAGVVGRLAARLCGVPVIIHTYHGHVLHGYFSPLKSRLFIWIERLMGHLSTRIIAVSPKVKDDLVRYRIAAPEKIQVLYLGLDLNKFAAQRRGGGTLRRELHIDRNTPLVGIVARLVPIKNIALFLKAAAELLQTVPETHFIVVGDGELRGELEALARQLRLGSHAHFLGFRPDVEVIYPDLDVLALTSSNEGSPVSLIEGLASGCAAVSTAVGGVPDVLRPGETGILVPVEGRNEETIALALAREFARLLKDPAQRQRLGENGRKDVLSRFSIDRLVADLDKLYRQSLNKKVL